MLEMNLQNIRNVRIVVYRKADTTVQLGTETDCNKKSLIKWVPHHEDDRMIVGGEHGLTAVLLLLQGLTGQVFLKNDTMETEECSIFMRVDSFTHETFNGVSLAQ